jgi:hypothetical protein
MFVPSNGSVPHTATHHDRHKETQFLKVMQMCRKCHLGILIMLVDLKAVMGLGTGKESLQVSQSTAGRRLRAHSDLNSLKRAIIFMGVLKSAA